MPRSSKFTAEEKLKNKQKYHQEYDAKRKAKKQAATEAKEAAKSEKAEKAEKEASAKAPVIEPEVVEPIEEIIETPFQNPEGLENYDPELLRAINEVLLAEQGTDIDIENMFTLEDIAREYTRLRRQIEEMPEDPLEEYARHRREMGIAGPPPIVEQRPELEMIVEQIPITEQQIIGTRPSPLYERQELPRTFFEQELPRVTPEYRQELPRVNISPEQRERFWATLNAGTMGSINAYGQLMDFPAMNAASSFVENAEYMIENVANGANRVREALPSLPSLPSFPARGSANLRSSSAYSGVEEEDRRQLFGEEEGRRPIYEREEEGRRHLFEEEIPIEEGPAGPAPVAGPAPAAEPVNWDMFEMAYPTYYTTTAAGRQFRRLVGDERAYALLNRINNMQQYIMQNLPYGHIARGQTLFNALQTHPQYPRIRGLLANSLLGYLMGQPIGHSLITGGLTVASNELFPNIPVGYVTHPLIAHYVYEFGSTYPPQYIEYVVRGVMDYFNVELYYPEQSNPIQGEGRNTRGEPYIYANRPAPYLPPTAGTNNVASNAIHPTSLGYMSNIHVPSPIRGPSMGTPAAIPPSQNRLLTNMNAAARGAFGQNRAPAEFTVPQRPNAVGDMQPPRLAMNIKNIPNMTKEYINKTLNKIPRLRYKPNVYQQHLKDIRTNAKNKYFATKQRHKILKEIESMTQKHKYRMKDIEHHAIEALLDYFSDQKEDKRKLAAELFVASHYNAYKHVIDAEIINDLVSYPRYGPRAIVNKSQYY